MLETLAPLVVCGNSPARCDATSAGFTVSGMDTPTRKPIDSEAAEDAARLKALFKTRTKLSQLEFGQLYEIGTQGAVWQYLNGVTPLNLSAAIKFSRGLGCSVSDFSPRLAAELAASGEVDPVRKVINALGDDDRQMVVDFLRFRVSASKLLAGEQASAYLTMIDNIARDLAKRKEDDRG